MIKNCLICNKEFKVWPCDLKRGKGKCCSRKCYYNSRIGIPPSEETKQKIREANSGNKSSSWKGGKVVLSCLICGEEFRVKSCIKNKAKFCSKKCHGKWYSANRIGEKSINWKGGITPINRLIRGLEKSRKWAREVKERDSYTCQICNVRGGNLRSNHIKKFSDYPTLRTILTNGVTICKDCDVKFVLHREKEWEDYFNLNLQNRGYLERTQSV